MTVPQRGNFLVGWVGDPVKNGQDARSTKRKFSCGVGRRARPFHKEEIFLWGWQESPPMKGLLTRVQYLNLYSLP